MASDLAGNTAAADLLATLDTVPPGGPVGNLVTVSRAVDGQATVSGAAGSVEANAWVVVTNLRTGESFSVLSGTDRELFRRHCRPCRRRPFHHGAGRRREHGERTFRERKAVRIRKLAANGIITTAANANAPQKAVPDSRGNLYVVESINGCVKKIGTDGAVSTIGCGFAHPDSLAVDSWGNLYVAEQYDATVQKIDAAGNRSTIISEGFLDISDLAIDTAGNLYIADRYGCRVARMDTAGRLTTVAGTIGNCGYSGDGGAAASARLRNVFGIALDASGDLFIGDHGSGSVRKVDVHGVITTVAGTGSWGNGSDGGAATQTALPGAFGVAVDPGGSIYVVEPDIHSVRKVAVPSGVLRKIGEGKLSFAEENGLGHVFSSSGLHEKTLDLESGVVLASFGYTAGNELSSITDRFGGMTVVERDGNGVPTAIVSPDGTRTVLEIDSSGRLSSVRYPGGGGYVFDYSSGGLLTTKTDGNGNRFEHDFDPAGRLLRERDQEGGSWTFIRTAEENGEITTKRTSAEGNVLTYVDKTDSTGAYASTITDPAGGETVYNQSANGLKATKALSCGKSLAFDYTVDPEYLFPMLRQMTETMPSGLKKTTAMGRAYSDSNGDGTVDLVARSFSVNGRTWTVLDNTLEGTKTATSPLRRTTVVRYDPGSLLTSSVSIPGLIDTGFGYDARGRLASITTGARQWTMAYDSAGNLSSLTDPRSRTTTYSHDAVGRLTGVVKPDGTGLTYAYDANGNLTVLVTPGGASHGFGYNRVNLGSSYTTPSSGSYTYAYDRERRLNRVLLPSGKEIVYEYDPARLTRIQTPEGDIDFTYLCSSKAGSVTRGDETISYGYDGPLVTRVTSAGTLNQDLLYSYGSDFRVSAFNYAGKTVSYARDWDGYLTAAGDFSIDRNSANGFPETVSAYLPISAVGLFHEQGPPSSALASVTDVDVRHGSPLNLGIRAGDRVNLAGTVDPGDPGTTTTTEPGPPEPPPVPTAGTMTLSRSFNGYGELDGESSGVLTDVSNSVPYAWTVTRDDGGRIVTKRETPDGVVTEYTYTYDALGRLLTVARDGILIEEYGYDANGNRVSQTSTVRGISRSLTYSDEDRLLTAGDVSYEHDADGFLTKKIQGASETDYLYSSRGELLRAVLPDGRVIEYVYDPLGRRIAKKVDGAIEEKYLWEGMTRLLAVFDENEQLVMRFSYADGRMPLAVTRWDLNYFLFYDQAGSLRMVTDPVGTLVKRVEYDSFGNVLSDSNPGFAVPFGFAGGLYDPDTGLVRFGYRDYDPDTGRWTAKDPILFAGGDANLYGYCLDDPVNGIDPQGLAPGDRYWNWMEAGMHAARDAYPDSYANNWEYGGTIYRNQDGTYSYTEARTDYLYNEVNPWMPIPEGATRVGDYHTHSRADKRCPGEEDFSPQDKKSINFSAEVNGGIYGGILITPSGIIKAYVPGLPVMTLGK